MNNTKNKDAFTNVVQIASEIKPTEQQNNQQVTNNNQVINLNQDKYKTS